MALSANRIRARAHAACRRYDPRLGRRDCSLRSWSGAEPLDAGPASAAIVQDPAAALNPSHTVDDILREPLIIRGLPDRGRKIAEMLDAVGAAADVLYRFRAAVAAGSDNAFAIARALLVEPQLLLLDEPTSAREVSVQAEILNLLSRLRAERGIASVGEPRTFGRRAHVRTDLDDVGRRDPAHESTRGYRRSAQRDAYRLLSSPATSRPLSGSTRDGRQAAGRNWNPHTRRTSQKYN